jgi:hypothetical protein
MFRPQHQLEQAKDTRQHHDMQETAHQQRLSTSLKSNGASNAELDLNPAAKRHSPSLQRAHLALGHLFSTIAEEAMLFSFSYFKTVLFLD